MTAIDLTTYSGLLNGVAQYLNRRDLSDQIPAFVRQAEAKLSRELRVRDMHVRAEASTDGDYIPMPSDYLATFSLELATQPGCWSAPLAFVSEEEAKSYRAANRNGGGPLRAYTIFGSTFELVPAQGSDVDFRLKYFGAIPALSGSNPSNWLLAKSPDLYVVSSCLEATPYLKADERLQMWAAMRTQIIDAMHLESERALKPQSALNATRRSFG
jgi:hypothetical protein